MDPEKRDEALTHLEQQILNQVLSVVAKMVEDSQYTRAEIAERMEWPLPKLNRMLEKGDDWSVRTLGEMSYATGIDIEFNFTEGQDLVPGPDDPALALATTAPSTN